MASSLTPYTGHSIAQRSVIQFYLFTIMDVYGVFGVRNDRFRGILIETLSTDNDTYFFKYHNQPLARHCEQVQAAVRSANVLRTKKIRINMSTCIHEYRRATDNVVMFKTTTLNSVSTQIENVATMMVNKEFGALKRATINAKKRARLEADEVRFQAERVERINKLFDAREEAEKQVEENRNLLSS